MTEATQIATQRNISRTRVATIISFAVTSSVNLLLIAYFARIGGLDLVGEWTFLNVVVMLVLILDFGVTNTLTYRIGRDGLAATAPLLRRAQRNGVILIVACVAGIASASALGRSDWVVIVLAALSASLQLASNWLITIRTGQHQQYFFNIKTLVRVLSQSVMATVFLHLNPSTPDTALASALFLGGVIDFIFGKVMTRGTPMRGFPIATLRQLMQSSSTFGLTSLSHQVLQPLSSLIVGAVLGKTGVAIFTLSLRIPVAISQSISEALRGLLPGLAGLSKTEAKAKHLLLRDAFVSQIALVAPLALFAIVHAESLLKLWLGSEMSPDLPLTLRMLLSSTVLSAISTPFFWANYAFGNESLASKIDAAITVLLLTCGGISLLLTRDIRVFVLLYAIAQAANALSMTLLAESRNGVVGAVLRDVKWTRLLMMLAAIIAINVLVSQFQLQIDSSATKLMTLVVLVGLTTLISFVTLKLNSFTE